MFSTDVLTRWGGFRTWTRSEKDMPRDTKPISTSAPTVARTAAWGDIWSLSWPQMLMMLCNFLIGFVDVWVAGRISSDVQASMGLINQLLFFFLVVAVAVANGSVAAVSQSMGAGLRRRALRYVGLVLESALAMGLVIAVLGLIGGDLLLDILQVPDKLHGFTRYFLDVFLLLLPIYYLFLISNAVFRAQRMVFVPLFSMAAATVVNTLADLGLGLGMWGLPNLGYKGLAWATFGSVSCGMLFNLFVLWRRGLLRRASFPPWCWIRKAWPYLYRVAWPGGLMQIVWQSAYLALFAVTGGLPMGSVAALAGMSAGMRIEAALFLPGFAFNMTASILVGEYLGAGRPDLAKRAVLRILGVGVAVLSLLAVAIWLAVEPITAFIAPDQSVQAQAIGYLRWNLLAIPFTLTSMILAGALAGAGATIYNLFVFGVAAWIVRVPMAYVLGHLVLGTATGVWISMLVSQVFQSSLTFYIFQCRNWARFAMRRRKAPTGVANATQLRTH